MRGILISLAALVGCSGAPPLPPEPPPPAGVLRLGMAPGEAKAAAGAPDYVTASQVKPEFSETARTVAETWTYRKNRRVRVDLGDGQVQEYASGCVLTFQDGKLVSVDASAGLLR